MRITKAVHLPRFRWLHLLLVRLAAFGLFAVMGAVISTNWALLHRAAYDTLAARHLQDTEDVERVAALLNRRVQAQLRTLEVLAKGVAAVDVGNADALEAVLRQRPLALAEFDSVFVVDREGRMVLLHDDKGWRRPELDFSDRAYFHQAMSRGAPTVSEAIVSRNSAEPEAVLAWPLRSRDQVVGIVAGGIKLRAHEMLADLRPTAEPANAVTLVVTDGAGHIVSHPDAALIGGTTRSEPRLIEPLKIWAARGMPVASRGFAFDNADQMGAGAGIPLAGWLVWRFEPINTVLAPLQAASSVALKIGTALTAVCGMGLFAIFWWQLEPLRQLKARSAQLFSNTVGAEHGWPAERGEIGELVEVLKQIGSDQQTLTLTNQRILQQLQSVMAAAPMGILLTRNRQFELASPEACRLLGRTETDLVGQPALVIYASNEDYLRIGPEVGAAFARKEVFVGELEFLRGDGTKFWGELRGQAVAWSDAAAGTIWTLNDITDQRAAQRELTWAATHDPLTGLCNRKALSHAMDRIFAERATGRPASVLLLDLDHFKPINDQHGHAAGDAMLRAVAQAVASCVRSGDLLARLGGDEFAVVLENCSGEVAERVAEEIRRTVSNMAIRWHDQKLCVGVSVGVAALTQELQDATAWLAAADSACYKAKAARNDAVRHAHRGIRRQGGVKRTGLV